MRAYEAIHSDLAHLLLVVIEGDQVLATMQLSFLPGLARARCATRSHRGGGLRQDYRSRSRGLGLRCASGRSRRRAVATAPWLQLSTDRSRADAHRFYEGLGFVAPHEGLKLQLGQ